MAAKHGGLGRGLNALIREAAATATPPAPAEAAAAADAPDGGIRLVPVERIRAGRWQPRHQFRPEAMEELVASIRERGVLQPLLVLAAGDVFELIAGERRLRAATAAGLREVPVRLMVVDDRGALEMALVEKLQREDLDPIEEAQGYASLLTQFRLTQEQVSERVGKARATVANALRLLELPDAVKDLVREGRLSAGHAKALLALAIPAEREALARRAVKEGLSVREVERDVARVARGPRVRRASRDDVPADHAKYLEERLRERLGTGVRVESSRTFADGRKARGAVTIEYYSADDLDRLMVILGVSNDL